jgi:Arc/MetJ-type ribon-helix-helix transcriptional regulator
LPTDHTRNVSPTAELNAVIRAHVASGQYQHASEVVRTGLRPLMRQAGLGKPRTPPPPDELQAACAAARGRYARQV